MRLPFSELVALCRCPACMSTDNLSAYDDELVCGGCGRRYEIKQGVPVLDLQARDVQVMPEDHVSNQVDSDVLDWLASMPGYTLNLGAGATLRPLDRCVEVEYSIFRNTSVVADAHRLPFRDDVFDAVICYNTFEHLYDPVAAAAEILRVLKPDGKLRLQTAFLQPLHEAPANFYDATEFGVRRWFEGYQLDRCFVPYNMFPSYVVGWIASLLLHFCRIELDARGSAEVARSSLGYWADFWDARFEPVSGAHRLVQNLSSAAQQSLASGFELRASRPFPSGGANSDIPEPPRPSSTPPEDGAELVKWLESLEGSSLQLGAGTNARLPVRCVQFDYPPFHTADPGDAHVLPFEDGAFQAVVCLNTFEHLADPQRVADEILRVLEPGGRVLVRAAFLQPLHEEPQHFYNATEFGLRHWFSAFEIDDCFVPPDMTIPHMLGWLSNHVLYRVEADLGAGLRRMAAQTTLSQWARFWEVPSTRHGFLKVIFDLMSPQSRGHISAGFEINATKPATTPMTVR